MEANDRLHTAFHEAGHAVIGRVVGQICGPATIRADDNSAGHAICADPLMTYEYWDRNDKYREMSSVFRGRIMAYMAGALAEREILGADNGGAGEDERQIGWMAEELPGTSSEQARQIARLRKSTAHLVKRHRLKIHAVAAALMLRETLASSDIDEIIRPTAEL